MICVSVSEKDPKRIVEIANSAEMAEIRIDLCGLNEETVVEVFSNIKKPTIATCRPQYCDDKKRAVLLNTAIVSGASFVDLEIESAEDFKSQVKVVAKKNNCKCIISYHNYENTPSIEELKAIVEECRAQGADIPKIATTAKSRKDAARVLSLYSEYSDLVALAMGLEGKITRVANLFLGSPFSFAAIDDAHATAGGQLTVEQMNICRSIIK
ncbi:MAG: type I 3-dehydroquinate dehydratase [Bacteroidales bacterium]|nr:type I 3-dehydroquinate dehydratase [Bacteroidales bacterium]